MCPPGGYDQTAQAGVGGGAYGQPGAAGAGAGGGYVQPGGYGGQQAGDYSQQVRTVALYLSAVKCIICKICVQNGFVSSPHVKI